MQLRNTDYKEKIAEFKSGLKCWKNTAMDAEVRIRNLQEERKNGRRMFYLSDFGFMLTIKPKN